MFKDKIKNQDEQTMGSKPVRSNPPWPLLQFLLQVPVFSSCPDVPQGQSMTRAL